MAIYDFLTGVYNRNAFEKQLSRLKKQNRNVYYFIADLNNLKETNDIMGHSAGDELLQTVAKLLTDATGERGTVFRQGGDAFDRKNTCHQSEEVETPGWWYFLRGGDYTISKKILH